MLSDEQITEAAKALHDAELAGELITPISAAYADADVADAYRISMAVTELKVAAGRIVKGHKIGLTSKAMRSLTGATEPDYGTLFDNWFVLEGDSVPRSTMNEPLVEIEIAFVLGAPLVGPGVNAVDVIRATDFVLPCIEIVDTRQQGRGPNRLVDSIADAAACGRVVLGGCPARLTDIDVRRIGATLVDQRHHRAERGGRGGDGQPDQRRRLAGQQAPRVRGRTASRPRRSSPARSSKPCRSPPATTSSPSSIASVRSHLSPSSGEHPDVSHELVRIDVSTVSPESRSAPQRVLAHSGALQHSGRVRPALRRSPSAPSMRLPARRRTPGRRRSRR